ncbi:MAG: DUF4911 domain-containing protein [Syntrophobacteraceae bacterium]
MSQPPKRCLVRHYLIDPYEIHYLRFIVEAYPGIGVVSTTDPALGLVSIAIAPGCESVVSEILDAEREHLKLREVDPDSDLLRNLANKI